MLAARVEPKNGRRKSKKTGNFKPLVLVQFQPAVDKISKTTDSDALQTLAKALQALATKLTEAQAQQALDPVLQQIGKTTNPYALKALAQAHGNKKKAAEILGIHRPTLYSKLKRYAIEL